MTGTHADAAERAQGSDRIARSSDEVHGALERFELARLVAALLVVTGASVARQGGSIRGEALVVAALTCVAAAAIVLYRARSRLVVVLAREDSHRGMDLESTRTYARDVAARITEIHARSPEPSHFGTILREDVMSLPEITITKPDLERLGALFASLGPANDAWVERLDDELARARVVSPESVPPDVVTMNSRVRFEDEDAGVAREITLVYPNDADADAARVSVLAPIGSALLGLRVGQTIDWPLPNGRRRRYRVLSVPYQPEASGDFHL